MDVVRDDDRRLMLSTALAPAAQGRLRRTSSEGFPDVVTAAMTSGKCGNWQAEGGGKPGCRRRSEPA